MMVTIFELLEISFINGIGFFLSQEFSKFIHSQVFKKIYKNARKTFKKWRSG